VVGWPRGYIARPSAWQEGRWFLGDNWPLGLPLLTLAMVLGVWRAYGRDPASNRSIKPEYEPPQDLVPAEAGALVASAPIRGTWSPRSWTSPYAGICTSSR